MVRTFHLINLTITPNCKFSDDKSVLSSGKKFSRAKLSTNKFDISIKGSHNNDWWSSDLGVLNYFLLLGLHDWSNIHLTLTPNFEVRPVNYRGQGAKHYIVIGLTFLIILKSTVLIVSMLNINSSQPKYAG